MSDWQPIEQIADDVKSGKLKAGDLVRRALQRMDENKEFDAVISTLEDRALQRAEEIDKNPAGRLAGVPFAY